MIIRDEDGYPTQEYLDSIQKFQGTPWEFVDYIREGWHWPEFVTVTEQSGKRLVQLVTGGWSGNEHIITTLMGRGDDILRQTMFWFAWWESVERGGRYRLLVPENVWTEETWLGSIEGMPTA